MAETKVLEAFLEKYCLNWVLKYVQGWIWQRARGKVREGKEWERKNVQKLWGRQEHRVLRDKDRSDWLKPRWKGPQHEILAGKVGQSKPHRTLSTGQFDDCASFGKHWEAIDRYFLVQFLFLLVLTIRTQQGGWLGGCCGREETNSDSVLEQFLWLAFRCYTEWFASENPAPLPDC